MKKTLVIFTVVVLVLVLGYFFLYKPLAPKKPKSKLEEAIEQYALVWDGKKYHEFDHLDDQVYIRQAVIRQMLESGELSADDLSNESLSLVSAYSSQIKWSDEWLDAVQEQVGEKYASLEEAIFFNAVWMVQIDGKLNVK